MSMSARYWAELSAREDYGVVMDVVTWTVDETATRALREELRAVRGWKELPTVSRK